MEEDGLGVTAWAVPLEGDQAPTDAILYVLRDAGWTWSPGLEVAFLALTCAAEKPEWKRLDQMAHE